MEKEEPEERKRKKHLEDEEEEGEEEGKAGKRRNKRRNGGVNAKEEQPGPSSQLTPGQRKRPQKPTYCESQASLSLE